MPKATVISHEKVAADLGLIGDWLTQNGYEYQRLPREPGPLTNPPPDTDLLIVLGSLSSVANKPTDYTTPAGKAEITLVKDWLSTNKPYLGVCFGAQVLARALGGEVTRMPEFFKEVTTLDWPNQPQPNQPQPNQTQPNQPQPNQTQPNQPQPNQTQRGPWVIWHEDAITNVGPAQVISKKPHAIVAFRYQNAWGFQPHFELDSTGVKNLGLNSNAPEQIWGPLATSARPHDPEIRENTFALLDEVVHT